MRNSHHAHHHRRRTLASVAMLIAATLVIILFSQLFASHHQASSEMRFTDASHSGLAIVPASGGSTPSGCGAGTLNDQCPCSFNGSSVPSGTGVTAYQSSTVPYGTSCVSETRSCSNGSLSGSYPYGSCSVAAAASCSFNGTTVPDSTSITAYQSASVSSGSCVSQQRTCSNGTLSGTYGFGSCNVVPSAPTCTLGLTPSTVNQSSPATLSWSSANSDSFFITGISYVTPNQSSSTSVTPSTTTTYTGTASQTGIAKTIILTSGSSWSVPADWNASNNSIEVIGGGGGGGSGGAAGGAGGGGGAYSKITNLALTPSASIAYTIGAGGGAGGTGGDTWFNGASLGAASVGAKGGVGAGWGATVGAGGASGSGIGSTKYSGGSGGVGYGNSNGGGAGGGAGGPHGAGAQGGSATQSTYSGAGGGAGGGGSVGQNGQANATGGGAGGNNYLGTGGGAGGGPAASGHAGSQGGGGGGAGGAYGAGGFGGAGGACVEWVSAGAGGGGGGGDAGNSGPAYSGGVGGNYGGGGGGGSYVPNGGGGAGAPGVIVITYVPAAVTATCNATLTVNSSCTFNGSPVQSGDSVTGYQTATVPFGNTCASETRTCSNGTLSGSYTYSACTVDAAASCSLDGATVAHGSSRVFYSQRTTTAGQLCADYSTSRPCYNGVLGGPSSFQYASCTCAPSYSCSGLNVTYTDASCSTSTVAACTAPGYCTAGQSTCQYSPIAYVPFSTFTGELTAKPAIIRAGDTTKLFWNVANAQSCTVSGGGQTWHGLSSGGSGVATNAISAQTIYTLSCTAFAPQSDLTASISVIIDPTFNEN